MSAPVWMKDDPKYCSRIKIRCQRPREPPLQASINANELRIMREKKNHKSKATNNASHKDNRYHIPLKPAIDSLER